MTSLNLPSDGETYKQKALTTLVTGVVICQPPGAPAPGVCIVSESPIFTYPFLNMIVGRKEVNKIIRALRDGRERLYPRENDDPA